MIKKEDLSTEQEKNETVHRSIEDLEVTPGLGLHPKALQACEGISKSLRTHVGKALGGKNMITTLHVTKEKKSQGKEKEHGVGLNPERSLPTSTTFQFCCIDLTLT